MSAGLRREEARKFLDASLVPLEHALLERARSLAQQVLDAPGLPVDDRGSFQAGMGMMVQSMIADEFQKLAKELHHW